jgi:hypothetical protein
MVVIGIGEIGAALVSETVPRRDDLARRERHMVGQGV